VLAREYGEDELVVVQETEYTGAGKHPTAQLTLARDLGISVGIGPREDDRPGERIVFPAGVEEMSFTEVDLSQLRRSYLRRIAARVDDRGLDDFEVDFLAEDLNTDPAFVREEWELLGSRRERVDSQAGSHGG
jgi:hypothetical protein